MRARIRTGGVVLLVLFASACTDGQRAPSRHAAVPPAAASASPAGGLSSRLRFRRVTALGESRAEPDVTAQVNSTFVVGKNITPTTGDLHSAVLSFAPVPVRGRCLLAAKLLIAIRSTAPPGAFQVYPSAALSLARGHLPPAATGVVR